MLFLYEIHQCFFWYKSWLGIFSQSDLQNIYSFRGDSKHFILNGSWWKFSQLIVVIPLELYQFFFLFFKTLIRWISLGLGFYLKVIFGTFMFIGDSKHFILNVFWWEHVLFHVLFYLELYQYFFCLFNEFFGGESLDYNLISKLSSEYGCS